jgi:hypothetical protein
MDPANPYTVSSFLRSILILQFNVTQMKNNKSPGYDEIPADMIKAAGPIGTQKLFQS